MDVAGISEHSDSIFEESDLTLISYDKTAKSQSKYIEGLLSTSGEHSEHRPKEEFQHKGKETTPQKSSSTAPTSALNLLNRKVGIADLSRGIAEKFQQYQTQTFNKRMLQQLKQHANDLSRKDTISQPFIDQPHISKKMQQKMRVKTRVAPQHKHEQQSKLGLGLLSPQDFHKQSKRADRLRKNTVSTSPSLSSAKHLQPQLDRYGVLFAKSLLENNKNQKESIRHTRSTLEKNGLSPKLLQGMEQGVKAFMAKNLKKQLKQHFLESLMYYDANEMKKGIITQDALNQYEVFRQMIKRSGKQDPSHEFELQFLRDDVKSELRSFIASELDRVLIDIRLNSLDPKFLAAAMDRFNALIQNSQFPAQAYAQSLNHKLDLHGLRLFQVPYSLGLIDCDWQRKKKSPPTTVTMFEGSDPDNQVRQLFYSLYTTPSLFKQIKLRYDLHKHKKAASSEERWNTLAEHAKRAAIFSLLSRLRHYFEERALLPDLAGDVFKFIQSEIAQLLKQLAHLGYTISKMDLKMIRDEANRRVFPVLQDAYLKLYVQSQAQPDVSHLKNESRKLHKILTRLKKESSISTAIVPSMFKSLSLEEKQISEAA